MNKRLDCIMLVDDDRNDNFYHEREIKKAYPAANIIIKNSGLDAIEYLLSGKENGCCKPDLIFLDINMPCMNGWEFLQKYSQLDIEQQSAVTVIMLSSSVSSEDIARTRQWNFTSDYIFKPVTKVKMEEIIEKYFEL